MNLDHYEPYHPLDGVPANIYFHSLNHTANVFTIIMDTFAERGNRYVSMSFAGAFTYRYTIESGRCKFLGEEIWNNPFNISSKSKYLEWFKEEGGGIYDDYDLKHYLIVCDDLIDVICIHEPTVEWLECPDT